jgi:hypothetical protein
LTVFYDGQSGKFKDAVYRNRHVRSVKALNDLISGGGHEKRAAGVESKRGAEKPYWAMSKDEYERAAGPGKRWVYHASEDPHAFDQGVQMANVPQNLARQRYEAGDRAEFAPGAGLGKGVYVGDEAHNVDGYGHYLHAFKVPTSHLAVPPEAQGYRPNDVEHHLKQSGTGALLTHDTPASDVVNMGRIRNNGFTGHEVHQLNALREGKPVPEENLSPRLKAYRDRYLAHAADVGQHAKAGNQELVSA